MPITAPYLKIGLRWEFLGQEMQTVRYFEAVGAAFLTATPEGVGEAYWNHVSTAWRALVPDAIGSVFKSVIVEEIGGGLGFGEYAIPVLEQTGTRPSAGLGDAMPSFVNVGIKYTVGTRLTRPGSMRVPFAYETDAFAQNVGSPFLVLVTALAALYSAPLNLGVPVALGVLWHTVAKTPVAPATLPSVFQRVLGNVVNTAFTTQVSRKQGRGS